MRYVGLAVVLFLLALSACGFHVRQTPQLPPEMKLLYISSSEQAAGLVRELARALASENTHIVTDPKQATAILAIQRASRTSRVLSVNNLGQPLEYEVAYEVQFSLSTNGTVGIPLQDLTLTRNYTYSISNAVANQEQANILYNALDRDMAQLIMFRIEAASRSAVSPRSAPAVATIKLPSVATSAMPAVL